MIFGGTLYFACADTPLNKSNWLGVEGARYWNISEKGSYYLDITEEVFNTSAYYAILISTSDVSLDGSNITISGDEIPSTLAEGTPGVYGVRVFAGSALNNIEIKHLNVQKKYYGIAFEGVDGGQVQNIEGKYNQEGLNLWSSNAIQVLDSIFSKNTGNGVLINAAGSLSHDNTIYNNTIEENNGSGISLWLQCTNNVLEKNVLKNNVTGGISLQYGSDSNNIKSNIIQGNPNGIYLNNCNNNDILGNEIYESTNVGIWLSNSNINRIQSNSIKDNSSAGIWLNSAQANKIIGNTISDQFKGIQFGGGNSNQEVYNNYFYNSSNVVFEGSNEDNSWYTQKTLGENITGGPFIAGNYWAMPNGRGFSQLCDDTNSDLICDSEYPIYDQNIDKLPLYIETTETALDKTNWLGSDGAHYWDITAPGTYYLAIEEDTLFTTHNYAIRISCPRVTLDGKNKTISGNGPPPTESETGSDVYGIRVNGGELCYDVHIKNFTVKNKFFGIILEAVENGSVRDIIANNNYHGIYLWAVDYISVISNSSTYNRDSGIVFDGNEGVINSNNIVESNVASNNNGSGISLWLGCTNNTIRNNTVLNNNTGGISLQNGANRNRIESNNVKNNPNGIFLSLCELNEISGNNLIENVNTGLWISNSKTNFVQDNKIENNSNAGIWLNSADNNTINGNEISDNTYWGIYFGGDNNNQTVYNNFFKNKGNVGFEGSNNGNSWNIGKTQGENIVRGPFLGGNFWATPNGDGFSQGCVDQNNDGLCDQEYILSQGNTDALPLGEGYFFTQLFVNQDDPNCGDKKPCYQKIQDAIDSAVSGATINVAQGTYHETFELNVDKTISISGGWDFSFNTQTSTPTTIRVPLISAGTIHFLNFIKILP